MIGASDGCTCASRDDGPARREFRPPAVRNEARGNGRLHADWQTALPTHAASEPALASTKGSGSFGKTVSGRAPVSIDRPIGATPRPGGRSMPRAAATPRASPPGDSTARGSGHRLAREPHQALVAIDRTEAFAARDQLALQAGHHRLGRTSARARIDRPVASSTSAPWPAATRSPSGAPAGLRHARRRGSASARRTDRRAAPTLRRPAETGRGTRLEHLRLDFGTRQRRPCGQAFGRRRGPGRSRRRRRRRRSRTRSATASCSQQCPLPQESFDVIRVSTFRSELRMTTSL